VCTPDPETSASLAPVRRTPGGASRSLRTAARILFVALGLTLAGGLAGAGLVAHRPLLDRSGVPAAPVWTAATARTMIGG
jgi:hypothetical protein